MLNYPKSIYEQAQTALGMLNCSHPDGAVSELRRLLERVGADSPDAGPIKRAIDRLDELGAEIAKVEYSLADVPFTFGKLEV